MIALLPLLLLPSVFSANSLAGDFAYPNEVWEGPSGGDFDFEPPVPSIRDAGDGAQDGEYLQHSSLWGHKYIEGGAGKGQQYLTPEGTILSRQEIKTDAVLPAYCEPPNPCPPGFSGEDGCLEEFDNTADFSRDYQARQDCMCDEEHMFTCPTSHSKVADLLQSNEDELDMMDFSARLNKLLEKANIQGHHKQAVAKKFHAKRSSKASKNPYLQGEKIRVVAKKGRK